jgi:hypothetical protein
MPARRIASATVALVSTLFVAAAPVDAQTVKEQKAAAAGAGTQSAAATATGVRINRVELDAATAQALAQYGVQIAPGDYWYDPFSGLFGVMGGPGFGFTMPGLELGGPLPATSWIQALALHGLWGPGTRHVGGLRE